MPEFHETQQSDEDFMYCWPRPGVTPDHISVPAQVIDLPKGFNVWQKKSDPCEYPPWVIKGRKLFVGAARYQLYRKKSGVAVEAKPPIC
jgi:hypothetical protein